MEHHRWISFLCSQFKRHSVIILVNPLRKRSIKPHVYSDFLSAIGLSQYIEIFESQKYNKIKDLEELSWEDLEDCGVKKLGHMKRLCIALKKLKTNREARQKQASEAAGNQSMESHYQSSNYPTSTLTSRSSTALGDHGSSFVDSACNTLRKPSRMSMPEQRQRPIAPVNNVAVTFILCPLCFRYSRVITCRHHPKILNYLTRISEEN